MDKDFLKSPAIPASPAPAYTPVANNDTSYHMAPLINGRLGDIELETVDGKKYLVHNSILEAETVFFHIYYGFVPVWRLNGSAPAPYHTSSASALSAATAAHPGMAHNHNLNLNLNFGGLSFLRKIITSTLTSQTASSLPGTTTPPSQSDSPPPAFSSIGGNGAVPPPPPATAASALLFPSSPKETPARLPVTAPTPTASPFTWLVPEPSSILTAFLSLIYPRGSILPTPTGGLETVEITGRVIRAALGYQSTKALTLARDHLSRQEWLDTNPIEVYSMACFFKFGDLAKLASTYAIRRPMEEWHAHRPVMGSRGTARLHGLYNARMEGLYSILDRGLEEHQHEMCGDRGRLREMWPGAVEVVKDGLGVESELLDLLQLDLRGGYCEDCMVVLGRTIQRCLVDARALPTSV